MKEVLLMSDTPTVQGAVASLSAGEQLRLAREATGLHIVALAAALKVPVRKLEALEANRWEELTDATFVRALAGSVARHLKIDAAPVLLALPAGKAIPIEVPENLGAANQPGVTFGPSAGIPKVVWLVLTILAAALVLYLVPDTVLKPASVLPQANPVTSAGSQVNSPATPAPSEGSSQGQGVVEQPVVTVAAGTAPASLTAGVSGAVPGVTPSLASGTPVTTASIPAVVTTPNAAHVASSQSNTPLTIQATADTWIEVIGADGKLRAQRLLKQGDKADFDDSPAFTVVLGNAAGAKVWIKGNAFDLNNFVKNNIARFEAK